MLETEAAVEDNMVLGVEELDDMALGAEELGEGRQMTPMCEMSSNRNIS